MERTLDNFFESIDDAMLLKEPYVKDEQKANEYMNTIFLLDDLQAKGKLRYSADKVSQPLCLHTIVVEWKLNDADYLEIDAQGLSEILRGVGTLLIDPEKSEIWNLDVQIYREA